MAHWDSQGSLFTSYNDFSSNKHIMWEEIQDMPGEIFDFDQLIEEIASDPEFIAQCEKNNAEWEAEVAELGHS